MELSKEYTLARTEDHSTRYYYKIEQVNPAFFMSVTTWQKKVLPLSPGLLAWMKNKTPEEQAQILLETSSSGTFFHYLAKEYADNDRTFPIKALPEWIEGYRQSAEESLTPQETQGWEDESAKRLYALNTFFVERNVVPLEVDEEPATEIALAYEPEDVQFPENDRIGSLYSGIDHLLEVYAENPAFPFAGALDLPCELDWNGSRVRALVDYKTGSIWDSHRYQLEAYKLLWNHNFPEAPIEYIFNWRPKDWRASSGPSYELKNQTDKVTPQEMAGLYILAQQWCNPHPRDKMQFGDIQAGEGDYQVIPANEYYSQEERNE